MTEEQAHAEALRALGYEDADDVSVRYGEGHSGEGWYAWITEYPEEGAVFLGRGLPPPLDGAGRIARERQRQIDEEGRTPEHDDEHTKGDLAVIAAALAVSGTDAFVEDPCDRVENFEDVWGLVRKHKDDRVRQLEIAGALIAAEIDRVLRAKGT